MKRIIPFVKDISFDTKISEITSIALEHNLKLENDDSVVGEFTISGKYKINEVSINEQDFEKEIPFDITLDDKYDSSKVKIDIDDFYYEVVNEEYLRIHIDVLVDNLVYKENNNQIKDDKKEEQKEDFISPDINLEDNKENETREIGDDDIMKDNNGSSLVMNDVSDASYDAEINLNKEQNSEKRENMVNDLYDNFANEKDNYVTYKVHIIRENETINDIEEKYNVAKEELEKYNTLDNIVIGSKIIVPLSNEQND